MEIFSFTFKNSDLMTNKNTPVKVGLLAVVLSYFLFTLHALFTLEWIGEWSRGRSFSFITYIEDISGTIGIVFRFVASIIAVAFVVYYFSRDFPSKAKLFKILRWVIVFEGIYWLGLSTSAGANVRSVLMMISRNSAATSVLNNFVLNAVPSFVESIVLPIVLFILAYKLSAANPFRSVVKWALIAGTLYVLTFWLLNSSIWVYTVMVKGYSYLTVYPQHLISFAVTLFGLLALTIYAAYLAKKSVDVGFVSWRSVGVVVLSLGMYFLWNYLSWIFFGSTSFWSAWYAWFLGHNLDLWMLSLPLLGLPLVFTDKFLEENSSQ